MGRHRRWVRGRLRSGPDRCGRLRCWRGGHGRVGPVLRAAVRDAGHTRVAQQHPVADVQRQRVAQAQPGDGAGQRPDPGHGPGRADVQGHGARQPHGQVGAGDRVVQVLWGAAEAHVDDVGGGPAAALHDSHAAGQAVLAHAAQVERHPGHAGGGGRALAQRLDVADPHRAHRRGDHQLVAAVHGAAGQRAGDHGAAAGHGERAVHPEPHRAAVVGHGQSLGQLVDRADQVGEPVAGDGADRDRGRHAQAAAAQLRAGLGQRRAGVGQVGPGDHQQAAADAQGVQHGQVLGRLGHPALVRGDHEQHGRDRAHPGQHVRHEALVARHVHERDPLARGQLEPGEAQVDGEAAALLLAPAVRIHPGERAQQR